MYLQRQARQDRGWLRVQFRLVRALERSPLANRAVWKSLRCWATLIHTDAAHTCNGCKKQRLRWRPLQGPGCTAGIHPAGAMSGSVGDLGHKVAQISPIKT